MSKGVVEVGNKDGKKTNKRDSLDKVLEEVISSAENKQPAKKNQTRENGDRQVMGIQTEERGVENVDENQWGSKTGEKTVGVVDKSIEQNGSGETLVDRMVEPVMESLRGTCTDGNTERNAVGIFGSSVQLVTDETRGRTVQSNESSGEVVVLTVELAPNDVVESSNGMKENVESAPISQREGEGAQACVEPVPNGERNGSRGPK